MNAKEAREKASNINLGKNKNQHNKIISQIETAVNHGNFEIYFYETIFPDIEKQLTKDGYKVNSSFNQKDGTTVIIAW